MIMGVIGVCSLHYTDNGAAAETLAGLAHSTPK